jgi:hypothetical protein
MAEKTFRVRAEVITYCYLDVKAESIEQANEIASKTDGGNFTSENEESGVFNVLDGETIEIENEEN